MNLDALHYYTRQCKIASDHLIRHLHDHDLENEQALELWEIKTILREILGDLRVAAPLVGDPE